MDDELATVQNLRQTPFDLAFKEWFGCSQWWVFSTFLECSQTSGVFYHSASSFALSNVAKTIRHAFSMFYTLIKHGFLTNQSMHRVLTIL